MIHSRLQCLQSERLRNAESRKFVSKQVLVDFLRDSQISAEKIAIEILKE
jgi:hypothetical protein